MSDGRRAASGPLAGVRVIELAGIGPVTFAGMLLADMGADVVRVDRASVARGDQEVPFQTASDLRGRSRRSIGVDLKQPAGVELVLDLVAGAEIMIEGFRPGVLERMGLAPARCLERNRRLVVGRLSGWGQSGPLAQSPGHDLNYLAMAGALAYTGRDGRYGMVPTPPLNLVGDFGNGGPLLAFGLVCALLHARATGQGQVVEGTLSESAALMMTAYFARAGDQPGGKPGDTLDELPPNYDSYETSDGQWLAVAAMEPQFYAALLRLLGLDGEGLPPLEDKEGWPRVRERLAEVFGTRTRAQWCDLLERADVCVVPVLGLDEVQDHPHHVTRGTYVEVAGLVQPAPTPRFSGSPPPPPVPPPRPGQHTDEVLAEAGRNSDEIEALHRAGVVA